MHETLNIALNVISALAALAQLALQVHRAPKKTTEEEGEEC
ncbi:hypothetical protein ACFUTV_40905 [Streptomyces sp. NPDC057298]